MIVQTLIDNANFGTFTNLTIVFTVTIYGIYWLKTRSNDLGIEFRYRAYAYWWWSWLVWVIAWYLLLHKQLFFTESKDKFIPFIDISILVFDNLNSIFLIIVYFIITRGQDLNARQAKILTLQITLSLASIYSVFYLTFQSIPELAYEIHRTCSMCIAVFTPILVGWAFYLRFKTPLVLMIGCMYGFSQPIIYATQLSTFQRDEFKEWLNYIAPIIAMIIGFLKVIWAIVFTKVLSSFHSSTKNLIAVNNSNPSNFWRDWSLSVGIHATVLLGVYCILTIFLLLRYLDVLAGFATSLGIVTGIFSFWQTIWGFWKLTRTEKKPK